MGSFRLVTAVRQLHLAIRDEIVEGVHAQGFTDIGPAHIYVFQTPGPDGARPTELARRALTTKQAMNHLLASLEAGGYLRRVAADGDGRGRVVRLTPKGRRLTEAIQAVSTSIERRWADQLGPARLGDLTEGMELLAALQADQG